MRRNPTKEWYWQLLECLIRACAALEVSGQGWFGREGFEFRIASGRGFRLQGFGGLRGLGLWAAWCVGVSGCLLDLGVWERGSAEFMWTFSTA